MQTSAAVARLLRAGLACAALAASGSLAWGQSASERITPNFEDTDLGQVARAVAMATHKTFIIDPRVRAQVTMLSSTPMSPDAFYQAFLAILQVHGFMAAQTGNIVKIVPDAGERYYPGIDLPEHVSSSSDEIVTQVIQVRNVSAQQLVPVLRPLVPQNGDLTAYPPANVLIISDRAANVSRLMRIIARIDTSTNTDVDVLQMQNASATDVARVVTSLFQSQLQEGGAPLRIVADERSNSILLSGDPNERLRARALIAHLDTPSGAIGNTEVKYLHYEDAEKLAPKLKEQITGESAAAGTGGGAASAAQAEKSTEIWADTENNALVITAPAKTMREINSIIDKLDIRRAQVLVEAIIVDVDLDKETELGVNWATFSQGSVIPGATFLTPVGGASLVDLASSIINPANLPSTGLVNGTTVAIGRIAKTGISFAAMLRALQSNDDSNIIATPSTVTMDHQEATIKIAQEVPFITGQYSNASTAVAGTVTPFQTIQREEVGTILKITPQINEGDAVILKISIESSSVVPKDAGPEGAVDLTTNKRTVETNVMIENGGIIVIGGLISNEYDRNDTGVPVLSHIPVLGQLFQDRQGTLEKKDLMIFIRPQILNNGADTALSTESKYNFIRQEQRNVGTRELIPLVPGQKSSVLPPFPAEAAKRAMPAPAHTGGASSSSSSSSSSSAAASTGSATAHPAPQAQTAPASPQ
ncbi:MAG TPA: type II secretion system secretin GspD [Steroidobacteraceae bacterium]|nr:type II secretion system secretin GspD [Steroidobacteraceae bacterium]